MKKINLLIALIVFSLAGAGAAFAESKVGIFGWWPGHWTWANYKHFNPHFEEGKKTQNTQWDEEDWYVQDWIAQSKDGFTLIQEWFRTGILQELDEDDDVPLLIVGPQFYRLGGFDKRRVLTTLDAVYGVTDKGAHPVILVQDWKTRRQIGVFTKDGLQLE